MKLKFEVEIDESSQWPDGTPGLLSAFENMPTVDAERIVTEIAERKLRQVGFNVTHFSTIGGDPIISDSDESR